MSQDLIAFLPWDTNHFGVRVARSAIHSVNAESIQRLMRACRDADIECLYFLAGAEDQTTIIELQRNQFDLVDVRVSQDRSLAAPVALPVTEGVTCRMLLPEDVAPLLDLSRDSIQVSRFFGDRCFDKDKVAEMYRIWSRKSFTSDFADGVYVAELEGRLAGCSTLHLNRPPGQGNIGLTLVADYAQGIGLGSTLVAHSAHWFRSQGMNTVNIVTQGQNIPAQRMHQRVGFRTRRIQLWFHKWFDQ